MNPILHHAKGPPTIPDHLYDEIFDNGNLGDWYWTDVIIDNIKYRSLYILIPSLRGYGQGELEERGIELISVFPSHAPNNWAQPGSSNGWDGNEANPTLSPSIFVGGNSDNPGWHGFFEKGQLRNA